MVTRLFLQDLLRTIVVRIKDLFLLRHVIQFYQIPCVISVKGFVLMKMVLGMIILVLDGMLLVHRIW